MVKASQVSVVLLAGGQGSRLGEITAKVPKPLLVVNGRPFIEWVALYLADCGVRDFVVSVGYLASAFEAWSAVRPFEHEPFPNGMSLRLCVEQVPLGTGGAVLEALPYLQDYCMIVNGDSLLTHSSSAVFQAIEGSDGVIVAVRKNDCGRYGTLECDGDWNLRGFYEKRQGSGWINAGVYLFRSDVLRRFGRSRKQSMEHDIVPTLLAEGCRIKVVPLPEVGLIDIGTPDSLREAEAFVRTWVVSGCGTSAMGNKQAGLL